MPPLFSRASDRSPKRRPPSTCLRPARVPRCFAARFAEAVLVAFVVVGGLAAGLSGCASSNSAAQARYRDYAVAVGEPYPEEAGVAQDRVNNYLSRLTPQRQKALAAFQYVAVEATTVS